MGWVKLFLLLLYVIFYSLDLRKKKTHKKTTHGTESERLIKAKSEWVKFMSSEVRPLPPCLLHSGGHCWHRQEKVLSRTLLDMLV